MTFGVIYLFRRLEQVEAVQFAEEFTLNINICIFLAVQDATFYSGDKIDKKYLSTGR